MITKRYILRLSYLINLWLSLLPLFVCTINVWIKHDKLNSNSKPLTHPSALAVNDVKQRDFPFNPMHIHNLSIKQTKHVRKISAPFPTAIWCDCRFYFQYDKSNSSKHKHRVGSKPAYACELRIQKQSYNFVELKTFLFLDYMKCCMVSKFSIPKSLWSIKIHYLYYTTEPLICMHRDLSRCCLQSKHLNGMLIRHSVHSINEIHK